MNIFILSLFIFKLKKNIILLVKFTYLRKLNLIHFLLLTKKLIKFNSLLNFVLKLF